MFVHASFSPIKAKVYESVLFNMNTNKVDLVPCSIVGVSSYPGHVPTFHIVVEGSSMFSYIPPHLLHLGEAPIEEAPPQTWGLKDLVYHNCPSPEFALFELEHLKSKVLNVFMKSIGSWVEGKYLFTMDWYTGNDLLHCLSLDNGQIAFLPHHKILLKGHTFKSYEKIRQKWKV